MKTLSPDQIREAAIESGISKKFLSELKFVELSDEDDRDFQVVYNRQKSAGLLIVDDTVLRFSLQKRKTSGTTGRIEPIICDICSTWRRGSESALLTLYRRDKSSVTYLCCGDLDCSLHVRMKTEAATLSKTQIREQVTVERRIERLQRKLTVIMQNLIVE